MASPSLDVPPLPRRPSSSDAAEPDPIVQLALCARCFLRAVAFFSLARCPPVFSSASPSLPWLLARSVNRSLVAAQSSSLELSCWSRAQPSCPGFRVLLVPTYAPCTRTYLPWSCLAVLRCRFLSPNSLFFPAHTPHAAVSLCSPWPVPARAAIISQLPAMRSPSSDFAAHSLVRHPVLLHGCPVLLHQFAHMAGVFHCVVRVPSSFAVTSRREVSLHASSSRAESFFSSPVTPGVQPALLARDCYSLVIASRAVEPVKPRSSLLNLVKPRILDVRQK
jgi:hypothetical protein